MTAKKNDMASYFSRFSRVRVMVVGDIMNDVFIWGAVKRISPEAPVPVVEVNRQTSLLGGAANVVNNIRALKAKAYLAGVIGVDQAGEEVLRELDEIKADRACVVRSMTRPTAVKTRVIAHHQQVVRFDREEKRPLKPSTFKKLWRAIESVLPETDAVVVSDYSKGLVSEELMKRLVKSCRDHQKPLAVDPKPANMSFYRGATVLTPNNREASLAAGFEIETRQDLERAGALLLDRFECEALLVTRGELGMSLFRRGLKPVHIPAKAREVYDVTGAGDTVIGVLAVGMAAGMDLIDAVKLANLAGGIVVGKVGTSVASLEEIKAALNGRKSR